MNKQFFVIIGIIVLAVVGYILVTGTSQEEQEAATSVPTKASVVLDYLPWSMQAGVWVAKGKGYFSNEGLDVTLNIPSDPSTVLQTVSSGRDDFGISYLTDVLIARSQNVPVVSVMALVQHPLFVIIALKESDIKEPKDLIGKKVGHSGLAFNELVMSAMLKNQGKSIEDIESVNVGFDVVAALIGKKVDAILGYESYEVISATNQGFPVNIMEAEKYGVPDYYEFVLVTNEERISKSPDVVQRFVKAVKRGYEDAMVDPEAAVQLMKKLSPEVDLQMDIPGAKLLVPLWKSENNIFGWQEKSTWIEFAKWAKDGGFVQKDVDVSKAFTNTFVENAR